VIYEFQFVKSASAECEELIFCAGEMKGAPEHNSRSSCASIGSFSPSSLSEGIFNKQDGNMRAVFGGENIKI